ncbi:MAG: hypothetical protein JWN95_3340 [Frankiales bacterium]|nr:hypothetical protein [Frankiales bacterium]
MQFSLFGAEVEDPVVRDLDGLLLAGAAWVRTDRDTAARLSVLVPDQWRVAALALEFAERGFTADTASAPGELTAVRTPITPLLAPEATRWIRGAAARLPEDLELSACGLRLWAIAAGRRDDAGYLLGVDDPDGPIHRAGGSQLSRLGVAAVSVGPRGGPGWRVTSAKRLRRLAELIGTAPAGAGDDWPGSTWPTRSFG